MKPLRNTSNSATALFSLAPQTGGTASRTLLQQYFYKFYCCYCCYCCKSVVARLVAVTVKFEKIRFTVIHCRFCNSAASVSNSVPNEALSLIFGRFKASRKGSGTMAKKAILVSHCGAPS